MTVEALITRVLLPKSHNDAELEIRFDTDSDVMQFLVNGKEVFGGDGSNNFLQLFKRALEIWDSEEVSE